MHPLERVFDSGVPSGSSFRVCWHCAARPMDPPLDFILANREACITGSFEKNHPIAGPIGWKGSSKEVMALRKCGRVDTKLNASRQLDPFSSAGPHGDLLQRRQHMAAAEQQRGAGEAPQGDGGEGVDQIPA